MKRRGAGRFSIFSGLFVVWMVEKPALKSRDFLAATTAYFGFIQTSTERLVATVEHCVSNPGRWVACSFISDDDGATLGAEQLY
ncbi:MAG TPA: sialidase family protein [Candidatus Atribacteria bacterium]|nr:sialidase family protein [Candidatus Atribacteria bacterium]